MRKLNISLCVLVNGQLINVVSISKYFTIFNSKFRRFCQRNVVLSLPSQKKGKSVSHEMKEEIVSFYEDDEISRIMPGKKEYVSIGRNIHKKDSFLLTSRSCTLFSSHNILLGKLDFQSSACVFLLVRMEHILFACALITKTWNQFLYYLVYHTQNYMNFLFVILIVKSVWFIDVQIALRTLKWWNQNCKS